MIRPHYRVTSLIVSGCLLALLAACGPFGSAASGHTPTASRGGATATQTTGGAASTPTTAPMPATQTACPTAGSARAAVFAPLVLGPHQNIVYLFNQVGGLGSGEIKRYDASTGHKVIIVNSPTSAINEAQISADGQWILFTTQVSGKPVSGEVALQLVRMDGQGLQTLSCSPMYGIGNIQWSPDQKTVAFMDLLGKVYLLNLATGHLQVELVQPPYASARLFFSPATWLDDTHLYMTGAMPIGGWGVGPPQSLYVLDTAKGANQQVSDLIKVFDSSGFWMSFASSVDHARLFVSTCNHYQGPSTIIAEPALGGPQTTVYTTSTLAVVTVRVISSTTMLLLIQNSTGDRSNNGLWKMNLDGTGLTRLAGQFTSFSGMSQSRWSNVSRDGSMYALQGWVGTTQALLIGSLGGTSPSAFATVSGAENVGIVGWTTM